MFLWEWFSCELICGVCLSALKTNSNAIVIVKSLNFAAQNHRRHITLQKFHSNDFQISQGSKTTKRAQNSHSTEHESGISKFYVNIYATTMMTKYFMRLEIDCDARLIKIAINSRNSECIKALISNALKIIRRCIKFVFI